MALTADELLHLDLGITGVTASGRGLLNGQRAHLDCVLMTSLKHGVSVWMAGCIVSRQKPPTAWGFGGFVFQDGSERVQVTISPNLWEAHCQLLRDARALIVYGLVTRRELAVTLVERLVDLPLIRRAPGAVQHAGYG